MCFSGGSGEIKETPLEKETARIAMEKYNYLRPQLKEAEDMYIDRVRGMQDDSEFATLKQNVEVTTGAQFDKTGRAVAENMSASGIDPTSGKFQGTLQEVSESAGKATSDAVNRAQSTQQDNAMRGLGSVVAMGEGKSAQALDGMMDVANQSSAYARQHASETAQRHRNQQGTLAFMAGAGYEAANGTDGG